MAGGTTAVPSNDLSTNLGRKKDFGLRKNTSSQVRGELRLDRADVVIDGMWEFPNFMDYWLAPDGLPGCPPEEGYPEGKSCPRCPTGPGATASHASASTEI